MILIRKPKLVDIELIVDINIKTWETTYGHIFDHDIFEKRKSSRNERIQNLTNRWRDGELEGMYVAEINKKVVGFIVFGPEREGKLDNCGEIYAIYILEDMQKKGIGTSLIRAATGHMDEYSQLIIWSLKDNPSTSFYKKIGGKALLEKDLVMNDKHYPELGFVYDLKTLKEYLCQK